MTDPSDVATALSTVLGSTAVDTEPAVLDRYSHDTWPVSTIHAKLGRHPYRPDVVVHAGTVGDIQAVLRVADRFGMPVTARGLGSSVTGQPLPTRGGIALDLSGLTGDPRLEELDRTVTVAAGVRGSDLERWLGARGYTLNHSPQSLSRSTVGGWVATRATGQFSSRYGGIEHLVTGYTCVLADGTECAVGERPRAAMGPDLKQLMIGSEGTLGIVTSVTMRVFALAETSIVEAFSLPSVTAGLEVTRTIAQSGTRPHLVRFYDADEARHALADPEADAPVLFIGHQGMAEVADAEHRAAASAIAGVGGRSLGDGPVEAWLERRYDFSTVEKMLDKVGGYAETIEVANVWSRTYPMYRQLKDELTELAPEVLCHFSHVYEQGTSLYVILLGQADSDSAALEVVEEIWRRAMKIVVDHDGEVSHHHGGGLARQAYARQSLGSGHELLRRLKDALDPEGMLNPGKLGLDQGR